MSLGILPAMKLVHTTLLCLIASAAISSAISGRPASTITTVPQISTMPRIGFIGIGLLGMAVYFGLGFPLPLVWCIGLIALSGALNIALGIVFPASRRLGARPMSDWTVFRLDGEALAALASEPSAGP